MLELSDLEVYYDGYPAVKGLSLSVSRGEIVGLTGSNGAGKTSTLRGVLGLAETAGKVMFRGEDVTGRRPHERVAMGMGYLPQELRVFGGLTVEENLEVAAGRIDSARVKDRALDLFPSLAGRFDRRGSVLSGGEQLMVALLRLLVNDPEILLLDEPTEGLMPEVERTLARVLREEVERGRAVLVAEGDMGFLDSLASRIVLLRHGLVAGRRQL